MGKSLSDEKQGFLPKQDDNKINLDHPPNIDSTCERQRKNRRYFSDASVFYHTEIQTRAHSIFRILRPSACASVVKADFY